MATHATRDHQEIRQWASLHGATPAVVSRSAGMLRFEFAQAGEAEAGPSGPGDVGWDDFFGILDEHGLELVYDDQPGSRFHKLAYPEAVEPKAARPAPVPPRARAARAKIQPIRGKSHTGKATPKAKPRTRKPAVKKAASRRPRKAA